MYLRQLLLFATILTTTTATPVPSPAPADPTQPPELRILSWNLWENGTNVKDYQRKQIRIIEAANADILGLQETIPNYATDLGQALGWYHWQSKSSVGIISRYPIAEVYGEVDNTRAGGVRIDIDQDHHVNLWTIHTTAYPYGPYEFVFDHLTPDQVRANETKIGRVTEITQALDHIQDQVDNADSTPVIFTGDFNTPSHLDWVDSTRDSHGGVAFEWPTSKVLTDRGFVDSYRSLHPDPATDPGNTWSPVTPYHEGSTGPKEPQDRVDFVYHKGKTLQIVDSDVFLIGRRHAIPDVADNDWTSDHAAVLTHYRFTS